MLDRGPIRSTTCGSAGQSLGGTGNSTAPSSAAKSRRYVGPARRRAAPAAGAAAANPDPGWSRSPNPSLQCPGRSRHPGPRGCRVSGSGRDGDRDTARDAGRDAAALPWRVQHHALRWRISVKRLRRRRRPRGDCAGTSGCDRPWLRWWSGARAYVGTFLRRVRSNAASAASLASGSVWRYFSVVLMLPWPRRSLTT